MNSREKKKRGSKTQYSELLGEKFGEEMSRKISLMLQMGYTLDVVGNILLKNTEQLVDNFLDTIDLRLDDRFNSPKSAVLSQMGLYSPRVDKLMELTIESKLRSIPEEEATQEEMSDESLYETSPTHFT